jgi:peptide/nickel transport system substrate-binding protein
VVKPTGELRVAVTTLFGERLDPILPSVTEAKTLVGRVFDYLWGLTRDNKMGPGVAERYEISPDGLVWTFYLRKGVMCHKPYDYYEITAEDVKFSIDRFRSPKSKSSGRFSLRRYVDRVEVVDRYTVRIYTKAPSPLLLNLFSDREAQEGMIMPKGIIQKLGEEEFFKHPIGSGPWKFVKHEVGSYIIYEANEDYWDKDRIPRFKTLIFFIVPEEATRVAMLRKGEADIIEIAAESKKEVLAAGLKIARVVGVQPVNVFIFGSYLNPNFPTYNKKVRQALQLAINNEEIVKYVFDGEAEVASVFPWTKRHFAYDPTLKPYPYDPERAKKLLAEAGYPQGFEIKIYTFPMGGVPQLPKVAEAVAGYWEKIGVKAKVVPIDWVAIRKLYFTRSPKLAGHASTWRSPGTTWENMPGGLWVYYHSKGTLGFLIKDPRLDKLIDKAMVEMDRGKRLEQVREIQKNTL